jgi:signal transduction histidine kinase
LKLLFTLLFAFLFCVSNAQNNYLEEWYSADTKDLLQNSIKSIAPDKYGFIWMTNENGLLRYDGKNFKVFNSETTKLVSNRFTYIKGNILKDSLKAFTEDFKDEFLIHSRAIKKNNLAKKLHYNSYEGILYLNSYHNNTNLSFIGSKIDCQNDFYYVIGANKITLYTKKNVLVREIKKAYQKNTLYFLYENELVLLDFKNNHYTFFKDNFRKLYQINIREDSKFIYNPIVQQLFVFTNSEIFILKKMMDQMYLKKVYEKPKHNLNIKSLYFDSLKNKLFIGTLDRGLNVVTNKEFKTLIDPESSNNNFYGSYPISDSEFITSNGLVFNKNKLLRDLKLDRSKNQYSLTVDKQNNIWIPQEYSIVKYYKNTNYKTSKVYQLNNPIATIFCDSKNKIWVGVKKMDTYPTHVYTIDASNDSAKFDSFQSLDEPVVFFTETPDSQILMVSSNKMIFYNIGTSTIKTIPTGINIIRSVFISKDNSIWICTYNNGFSLFKDNKFYKMPSDNNMYLLSSHCIQEDKRGHFWISTNKGLFEVNKQSLINYYKHKTPVYYHHYTNKNGFLTNEFNGGCQPCSSNLKNDFIFPSLNGLVLFNPDEIRKILPSNDFFINEVQLDGKTHYFSDTLKINRKIERVTFIVDFAYFGNSENVFFEGKLKPSENEKWINLSSENQINFTNLNPGTHELYIRKIIPFTSKYQIKKVIIQIPFYFYEKLWFKLISSVFIIALIGLILRKRYNVIREKNMQLEIIVQDRTADLFETISKLQNTQANLNQEILQQKKLLGTISHDIKSPLRFLSITAKHVYEKSLDSENTTIKENAHIMYESSSQLYKFVENLVDYSKVFMEHNKINGLKKENIDDIINDKISLFKNMSIDKKNSITYKNNSDHTVYINRSIFGIMIHNLLDNAIKNTNNGTIKIEINTIKSKIYINIEDNGVGISEELITYYMNLQKNYETDKLALQNYGLGLHMVLELLRLVKGEMKIYGMLGIGTKITLIVDEI